MKARVLGIGVATLDIYPDQGRMYPGGNEYNVACNAKILGADAGFLGVFGDDRAGEILEDTLTKQDISTALSHHEKGSSGYSIVKLNEEGDREFLYWNQQGVTDLYPFSFSLEEIAYIKTYDVACIGMLSDVELPQMKRLYEHGVALSYDFDCDFSAKDIEDKAPYIKYAFFSCSHLAPDEIRDILKRAVDLGASLAVATRGCEPVLAYDGTRYYEQATFPVKPIDTLGAGDSYIAGVLVSYLEDHDLSKALAFAARHSAHVVTIEGAIGIGYEMPSDKIGDIVNI